MKALKGLSLTVVGTFLLMLLALVGCQRDLLYFPSETAATPNWPGLEIVALQSEPDLEVRHFYVPPPAPEGPVVVVFHGNAGHAGHRVRKFQKLLEAGIGVFFAEYRGYGGNPGEPSEDGLTADALAVMAYIDTLGVGPDRIVLYGESLGTGVAVKMAVDHSVAGVILEAPYTSIAEMAELRFGGLPLGWLVVDAWETAGRIEQVNTPLLVVHGEADRVIPVQMGRQVFDLAPEPKAALFHPAAGHNNLFRYPEVVERVIAFVRERTGPDASEN